MRAVGFTQSLPVTDPDCLLGFELPVPEPGPRELLVKVVATSVNPVDTKRRINAAPDKINVPIILGFDAVGIVEEIGIDVQDFKLGDNVWYAGSLDRPGSNAEYQCIDERIVGHRPESLTDAEAAALPLTGLTAWECLFDRMLLVPESPTSGKSILVIGGAGGVGSVAIQLANQILGLNVIATASRDETANWCRELGAHHIADHRRLVDSVRELGFETVSYVINCADTLGYWDAVTELIEPEGRIGCVVESAEPVDLTALMPKSVSFSWEMMSTRPVFQTRTMHRQGEILERLAELADKKVLRSTLSDTLHGLSPDVIRDAHVRLESRRMIGKLSVVY